jgi:hypothetical protein
VLVPVPTWTPFLKIRYPVTATLSVEAVHDRFTLEDVTLEAETPVGAEGGVVSGVVTESPGPDSAEAFPAASKARMA